LTIATGVAAQDFQVSVYGGYQTAPHSGVEVTDGTSFTTGWDGKSFTAPIYYGARGTWWLDSLGMPNTGLSIDFSHTKVYSNPEDWPAGWTHFEFTDGLNLLTANALYSFTPDEQFRPYVGIGAGISIPHVEVIRDGNETWEYQFGGPTLQVTAGFDYMLTDNWSLFAEYKGNYSWVNVDIDSGDQLETKLITNALNVGVSFHF
jgi:lipid A oxidase